MTGAMMAGMSYAGMSVSGGGPTDGLFAVLTPAAAAEYLHVPEMALIAAAEAGRVPGRRIGDEWRFLKLALVEWLSAGCSVEPPKRPKSSKERMLALAGMWKDDPTVDAMVEEIYRERKRSPIGPHGD
jgi:excisionase family DNA binding protein